MDLKLAGGPSGDGESADLASARRGDQQAFERLCERHRGALLALCMRFLDRREDAEDIVQEVFCRAWSRLDGYRGDAALRTWLWEIARNLCLNQLRARGSRLNRSTVPVETLGRERPLDLQDGAPTPEEAALGQARVAHLREAITRHAERARWKATDWELFTLRLEQQIPYAEFARRRGRDEAYWRNRWRDKIKPVLERVRAELGEGD